MEVKEESNESLTHNATLNGTANESCILIDKNITTIELDDTIEDPEPLEEGELKIDESETVSNGTCKDVSDLQLSEYEVVDQVGDFESGCSQEIDDSCRTARNGPVVTDNNDSFVAPDVVDFDVTPTPIQEESDDSKIIIDIKFQNRKTYLAFQEEFIQLVKNYYKSKLDDMSINDDVLNNRICVSEKRVKQSDTFLVDRTPNLKNLSESTPTYRKSFGRTMLTGEKDVEEANKKTNGSRNACFNCDKNTHSLRDCPEPRNMKKVNKARNEYSRKELRYHDDSENEYGAMIPGEISDELRSALGLRASQIPLHVYRMRLFGYSPGWIEEAKIHHSGLSLFVEKDKKQLHPGADEGEMEENNFKYDVQKIHEFPGFNVQPRQPYRDEYRIHNTPPILPQHSKEEMIRSLGGDIVNGYKKTKLRKTEIIDLDSSCEIVTEPSSVTVTDMDIEDVRDEPMPLGVTIINEPPLPLPPGVDANPPEPTEEGELSEDGDESITELTRKRKELLAEIGESSVLLDTSTIASSTNITSSSSFNNQSLNDTIIENSENENRDNCARDNQSSQDNAISQDNAMNQENTMSQSNQTSQESREGQVDATIFGCPVLKSFSPFSSLPDGEKFQAGVCDVIAFENLAESTGKYEKMKALIKKVRVFQQEHQKE